MTSEFESVDELETGFGPFTLRFDDDEDGSVDVREFDPINLVFPGLTLEAVFAAFERAGWRKATSGAVQSLNLEDGSFIEQAAQMAFYDEDDHRYHVRFWAVPEPAVLAAVHHEREFLREGRIIHRVDAGFEVAEAFVVDNLLGAGQFTRERRAHLDEQARRQRGDGDSREWRGWENHPRASVMRAVAQD